jgi:hypothetical protein
LKGGVDLYSYVSNPNFCGDPFGLAKTPTSTLRKIWTKYSGTTSSGQVHHGSPEQLAGDFKNLGNLNVNDGKYFFDLTPEQHITGSPPGQEWNAHWRQWLTNNRATPEGGNKRQARRVIEQQ